ncbi:TetR/AcrR family transcriptional regulator [Nesterenkonia aurantiaca]|uniref:TetR family transcriptional regulator n=1 Tax=Nesterenkonia aurantiaca TaxID=1436010 RepID=A0A4R7FYD2_9MICC|nr:TetR/AcrR family transcriptional regulator [Nesterenkonia aurantiaca]TDS83815.1 TetR family transcriptional regulator [Nesterenkonia aurantiaca]
MSSLPQEIAASSEQVFDHHGFAASGIDTLAHAAGVSTRTLYKHMGSKADLIAAALEARSARFFDQLAVTDVDGLFAALEQWVQTEGARGCFFLRAAGELSDDFPEALKVVTEYRRRLRTLVGELVNHTDPPHDDLLAEQILVLFEGATSVATYRGVEGITAARAAAASLVHQS